MEQVPLIPEAILEIQTDSIGRPLQAPPNGGQGRPRGSHNHTKRLYEEELSPLERRALIRKTYTAAMEGNPYDRRSLLDRIWKKDRSEPIEIDLPDTNSPADILRCMHQTFARMKAGDISPDVCGTIIGTLKDMLAAHSIDTLTLPGSGSEANGDEARALLLERINRVVEARRRRVLAPADENESAA